MKTEITYTIYGIVKFKDINPRDVSLITFNKQHEFDNFRISYEFYKAAQLRYLKKYGDYPTFPKMREIFDKSNEQIDIQRIIAEYDHYAIIQIRDFIYAISNIWDESIYSIIEDISDFTIEEKIVTIKYTKKDL